jgi:hypothetical protein
MHIVGGHLHLDAITHRQAHPPFAHFAANGSEHEMFVVEFDAKHGAGQNRGNTAFDFNVFFFHAISDRNSKPQLNLKNEKAEFGSSEPRPENP